MELRWLEFRPAGTAEDGRDVWYELLTRVMYTAGQAGLSDFKFAVIKR